MPGGWRLLPPGPLLAAAEHLRCQGFRLLLRASPRLHRPSSTRRSTMLVRTTGWLEVIPSGMHWRAINVNFSCTANVTHPLPEGQ